MSADTLLCFFDAFEHKVNNTGGDKMKKIIISLIVSIIIMLFVPFLIVEFFAPAENADSTESLVFVGKSFVNKQE